MSSTSPTQQTRSLVAEPHWGLPELALASYPLGHLELGVEVVVGPTHLSNTDPVLPFERQLEWTPAEAGGQIHDEAHDISESNDTNIPTEEKRCQALRQPALRSQAVTLPGIPDSRSALGPAVAHHVRLVHVTCACPTKQLHSLWSEEPP